MLCYSKKNSMVACQLKTVAYHYTMVIRRWALFRIVYLDSCFTEAHQGKN